MMVEIWSDVVCPWCAIGKRRFEQALAGFEHRDAVQLRWRSFELDPQAPPERPGTLTEYLSQRYGRSREDTMATQQRVIDIAAAEGWEFHLDRARSNNTFDAHRMVHLAADNGIQDAVQERLMRGYFTEGERISDHATLVRLVSEAGLDAGQARAVLDSDRYADAVRADQRQARELGISGVPFFVFDRRYGVSGAQPTEALLEVLQTTWAHAHPAAPVLTPPGQAGEACADDSCAI